MSNKTQGKRPYLLQNLWMVVHFNEIIRAFLHNPTVRIRVTIILDLLFWVEIGVDFWELFFTTFLLDGKSFGWVNLHSYKWWWFVPSVNHFRCLFWAQLENLPRWRFTHGYTHMYQSSQLVCGFSRLGTLLIDHSITVTRSCRRMDW